MRLETYKMDFSKILFNIHSQNTINNPICHIEFDLSNVKLINTQYEYKKMVSSAYLDFKKLNFSYGSVDIDPLFWGDILLQSYIRSSDKALVSVPNGCCNIPKCPITSFYYLIVKQWNAYLKI